jgi:hypothetical protein
MSVTTAAPAIEGATAAQDAARDWQAVHGDPSIQFAPVSVKLPSSEPPGWLKALAEFFEALFGPIGRALGVSWPVLQWVLLGIAVLAVLWLAWRVLGPVLDRRRLKTEADAEPASWAPQQEQARALLAEADRLAAEGNFDEATHLLLKRSVEHIADTRPEWVQTASTAREITAIAGLSDSARAAFGLIAARTERSLFALRRLDAGDWQAAREAYASFALGRIAA